MLAAATAVALNFPMSVPLVRTGSLALPVAIHVSLHVMKGVLA